MSSKEDFRNRCFSPNWLDVDLEDIKEHSKQREVSLEKQRHKDLNTLLKELDEIKQDIERVAEKQHRLANLLGFYSGEFVQ